MRYRLVLAAALGGAIGLASSLPAAAQYTTQAAAIKGMDERFRIDFGGFFQKFDTLVTISGPNGQGTEIDLEDVLGEKPSQTTLRVDGYWRFGSHGRLAFGYRGWSRSGDRTIDREIQIGDTTYEVGAQVSSKTQVNIFQLYYGYSFVNSGAAEVGLELGISGYYNRFTYSATGNVTGPGGVVTGTTGNEYKNFLAPVPALGGYINYALYPKFFFFVRARGLPTVTISGYSGNMVDVLTGLDFYFTKNFGIGGGYEYDKLNFSTSRTPNFKVGYRYSGPLVYLSLAF